MADEERVTATGFKDTRVKVVYTVGFVAASLAGVVGTILVFGLSPLALFGGIMVGGALGTFLASMYVRNRMPVRERTVHAPGRVACPECGSVQTDVVKRGEAHVFACFSCDHEWGKKKP